jgi:hypothetical protein
MSKTRLLDEEDVKVITNSEIDEIIGSTYNGPTIGGGNVGGGGDCNCGCDGSGSGSGGGEFLPEDYEGIITDEDIEDILNS